MAPIAACFYCNTHLNWGTALINKHGKVTCPDCAGLEKETNDERRRALR